MSYFMHESCSMILIDQPGYMEYIFLYMAQRQNFTLDLSFMVKSETAIRPDTFTTKLQLKNTVVRHLTVDIFINV